jgi:hypothetical protein
MRDLNERRMLAEYGVHFSDDAVYAQDGWGQNIGLAMDAQPQLVTTNNVGIPSFLSNILDPQIVETVLTPLRAAEIAGGEIKRGDWTSMSLMMPVAEQEGSIVTYGDYEMAGSVDTNVNWVARQPYHYQTVKRTGERDLAVWGLAAIDQNARKDRAVVQTFARFQNRSYFFGVANLQNYGLLNDPSLITPITPATKAAGGTAWTDATAEEIYNDVLDLYIQLQTQMGGNLEMTDRMELVLSTTRQPRLATISTLTLVAVNVALKANFPNLTVRAAPEYTTASGELMQLIVPEYEADQTLWAAFTEKLRAHQIVQELSAWSQKFSGGTWGTIVRRPIAVGQMLGI